MVQHRYRRACTVARHFWVNDRPQQWAAISEPSRIMSVSSAAGSGSFVGFNVSLFTLSYLASRRQYVNDTLNIRPSLVLLCFSSVCVSNPQFYHRQGSSNTAEHASELLKPIRSVSTFLVQLLQRQYCCKRTYPLRSYPAPTLRIQVSRRAIVG